MKPVIVILCLATVGLLGYTWQQASLISSARIASKQSCKDLCDIEGGTFDGKLCWEQPHTLIIDPPTVKLYNY